VASTAPRRSVARKNSQKQIPLAEAKQKVLAAIADGLKLDDALEAVGRTVATYHDWRKKDPEFRAEADRLRSARADQPTSGVGPAPVPDFPRFCEELGQPLHAHQLRMWDVMEGRKPRDPHPAMRYQSGTKWESACEGAPSGRVIINLPPGHAKTTTFSINYTTWLIHKNPNVKIIVVSKDQGLAKQILGAVKFRLTSPVYRDLHARYAPEGGWKDPDQSWTQTEIYVQGKGDGEKDPTMQALGIGGRIYGARSDVIILDDAITLANVNEHEKQQHWLEQEVESRLDGAGLLALLGTRIAPIDLYSELREMTVAADFALDEEDDGDDLAEVPVYTYFSMPAILEEGDGNWRNWTSLWPEKFPPAALRRMRRREDRWALVYQQQDVAEDATFNARAVEASINSLRFPGPMTEAGMGHRPGGMNGLHVIGGLDPATTGATAMIVLGLDRMTEKRYVLDGFNQRNTSPSLMRDTVKRLTDTYGISEWVIERNAFQRFLTQDDDLTSFLRSRGCRLTEHYTHQNKYDADFGIAAMAPLFLTCGKPPKSNTGGVWDKTPESALIELPSARQNAWVSELVNQLVVWQPSGMKQLQKTDLVMALWFTEIAVKRILNHGKTRMTHMSNPFASGARIGARTVVNLAEYKRELLEGAV